jgi:hypothetical protein
MPSRTAPRPPEAASPPWRAELGNRMADRLVIKVVSVSVFVALFFQGYFHTLRQPVNPVTTMPLTPLDTWIPFEPWAIVPYFSLWFYVGIAPGLLLRWRDLIVYGLWAAALCAGGLAIFHAWPTEVPARAPEMAGLPGFALLAGVDGAGNACPSLHVATAVFTATWVERLLRAVGAPGALRAINLLWLLAIVWSTVAVRQHVVLDVVAGLGWGLLFAALSHRLSPGIAWRPGQ